MALMESCLEQPLLNRSPFWTTSELQSALSSWVMILKMNLTASSEETFIMSPFIKRLMFWMASCTLTLIFVILLFSPIWHSWKCHSGWWLFNHEESRRLLSATIVLRFENRRDFYRFFSPVLFEEVRVAIPIHFQFPLFT